MPKIRWTDLPQALREHLFERLRERKISAEHLYELKLWRESEPEAPDGTWYKDFGARVPHVADDDWRKTNPRFTGENFQRNRRIVDDVQPLRPRRVPRRHKWR